MDRLLLKGVLHDGRVRNILIEDKRFKDLDAPAEVAEAQVFDASGSAILPAMYNTHTHAAMTLLRGYADDMPLQKWLQEYIWPFEDKLTPEDIRKGSEIAVREMVQSGTVFFNDMYFDVEETIDIVNRTGTRAAIGITVMENHSKAVTREKREFIRHWQDPTGGRVRLVMAPHAIYTVGERKLRDSAEFAREHGMLLHIHLSETVKEVEDCLTEHGTTPVRYLDSIGFLGPDVIAAHCVHVDDEEAAILAERGVTVSHCPCSNMKLGSGVFPYSRLMQAGCRITLGTDGASSGNNLDLREAMKFAALLAKSGGDPELLPAEEVFRWATRSGAEAFGIDAGVIAEGKLADCLLIDLSDIRMQPCHHLVSNFVYSADSRCIKHVLCDGRIVL
ncbi:MAG: amidohydrolase [Bacteroidales bacterium]|nr:amidohydrolase [Bacteroidales bacterium]MBQ6291890.1 amidohydrolase [Bacteroidales bacterium]